MSLAPVIKHQFLKTDGTPAAGYKLFSYEAGTTTKLSTYSDADLAVPNTNPLVLDAAGRATIFLSSNTYKFSLATDTDIDPPTSPIWTVDEVSAVADLTSNQDVVAVAGENVSANEMVYLSDGSGGKVAGRWYLADASATYSSSAALLVGMAPAAITAGETGVARIVGRLTGLSSLTAGSTYYASSSTPGAITATAPSNQRAIGFADTSTSLIIWSSSASSGATASGGSGVNLCADGQMLVWAAGDAAAPSYYALGGTTPTIARAGTGLGDTNKKYGQWCAKITAAAGGAGTLVQSLLPAATFEAYWQSRSFSFGAWVKCSTGSSARLQIYDGVGTSSSSYHTGAGAWEWITVTRTLDAAADRMQVQFEMAANIVGYVSGFTCVLGSTAPSGPLPSSPVCGTIVFKVTGALSASAGTVLDRFIPSRPLIVKDVLLYAGTAPTGDHIDVDVVHWDGSAWQSMFSTRPEIVATAQYGQAQPDGTYRYRCIGRGNSGALTDGMIGFTVEDVGSGTAGSDLTVFVRAVQFARPLEDFLGYNE